MAERQPDQRLNELAQKMLSGDITASERMEYEQWYSSFDDTQHEIESDETVAQLEARLHQQIFDKGNINPVPKETRIKTWPRIAAAASILLALSAGSYFLLHQNKPVQTAQNQFQDIAPGSSKATLTLANGKQIVITGAKSGLIATQGNIAINLTSGEQVTYAADQTLPPQQKAGNQTAALQYNTLSTPRGGQHSLTLADGTKVWLDAASSITFPVAFNGSERAVKITGQVYFEVAHDAHKPFKVSANGETVEVLGTHFNINAYAEEAVMKTTLFQGSVKISTTGHNQLLKPGQQAEVANTQIKLIENADIEEALAWHNGLFQFHSADMKTVLRQLSRWYDVDFVYDTQLPERHFSGDIVRTNNLKIADILKYEKINFRMEGKKITIIP